MQVKRFKKGITLIETLLYVSIAGLMLFAVFGFLQVVLETRTKNIIISEVDNQALIFIDTIVKEIRNSEDVITPARSGSSGILELSKTDTSKNPTVFEVSNNSIYVTEGTNDPVSLTNSQIEIDELLFENLSFSEDEDLISVTLSLSYKNPEGRQEFSYTKTYHASARTR